MWRLLRPLQIICALLLCAQSTNAQDRLKTYPGYARHQKMAPQIPGSIVSGSLSVTWTNDGEAFISALPLKGIVAQGKPGKKFLYDIPTRTVTELATDVTNSAATSAPPVRTERRRRSRNPNDPGRGKQFATAISPDGKLTAFCRDRNLWLKETGGSNEVAVTTDGSEKTRIKYATASWVYGEELDQKTAMWWSSNSQMLALYRFDETGVPDYFLALDQTRIQDRLEVEAYPKAGSTNPVVDLLVYDLKTKCIITVNTRDGQPFDNNAIGHYLYGVEWSPDGTELLFHRTNRRQNIMEFCAADPRTGKCRVIVREEWPASWVENSPPMRFLSDGRRFLWISERTGWKNLYLYELTGRLAATLTHHLFEVSDIVRVDEDAGMVYYMARSGDNPLKPQLHCVTLDGQSDRRLTDPAFHHTIDFSPNGRYFIEVAQTHDSPPVSFLRDAGGKLIEELAQSDVSKFQKLDLHNTELLRFKAADGCTDLYGMLHFPSDFRPYKKYPLLVSVYAGPETQGARETFMLPDGLTEYGFLVATFDSRSAGARGKRFLDAIYGELGRVEIDDQAAGVRSLWPRRYVDKHRVGIFGTSYGGTASAMCLLRYPDVFKAACSQSPVTDFRNYDTIYTERYLWLPQENAAAYDAVSLLTHAGQLHGRLMLYYGSADDNVHPSNMMQFVQALQKAGKSFDLQVGPDRGHSSIDSQRMVEFFIENLVLN